MELFWYMMALVVPAFLIVMFTAFTRNRYVAIILVFIIFAVSISRGFYNSEWVIYLDALSIVIGYILIDIFNIDQHQNDEKK
ncbi:DUF2198 family protein [Phocicoccus pinnipedialis]|uniref:Protein CsbA n=1 Tax=Phocicoccus pinnipedialis TaxID=110845 RepID=A0A6V7R345_9BACL|nr:DUF2198 family protein [Jeotgalicoccus pinnipedialis]MBP1938789.1 general stress protein CsbA [Jeotgalicoccus pinnipedialis]CAD2071555.1 hypothetical protein JEOPIN946_00100 [Jeotgalicoccus pinnipedialis]